MTIQIRSHAPVLLERLIYIGLFSEPSEFDRIRRLCWGMGAMTSDSLTDQNITHILIPTGHADDEILVDAGLILNMPVCVRYDWIMDCNKMGSSVDELEYIVDNVVVKSAGVKANPRDSIASRSLAYRSTDAPILDRTKPDSARTAITRRRSDISSVPLRPDGVFQGVELSLLGWFDARTEASLSYQITTNGGSVVEFGSKSQYGCVCSDGSRPTRQNDVRLVSQRWVNDCLASGALVDPLGRVTYTPSSAQLPLLMMKNLCLYLTEKEPVKLEAIQDVAKLCGIRCVVSDGNSSGGTRLSAVTHFIFHDLVSFNRRRDLVPLAKKSNKFVVSFDWLKQVYLQGTRPDESQFDPSVSMFTAALTDNAKICSPSLPDDPPAASAAPENAIVWENKHAVQLSRRTQ